MSAARLSGGLMLAGGAGAVAALALGVAGGASGNALPIALAVVWFAAGAVASRARPDHLSAQLLLAVGSAHLVGFALASAVGISDGAGWGWWLLALAGNVVYGLGFAALALLFAVFPDGALPRGRMRIVAVGYVLVSVLVPVLGALTSARLELVLSVHRGALDAPAPLPLGPHAIDLWPVVPLLVLGSLVVLVRRALGATGERRHQLMWPLGAAGVLVLMLLATPAGTAVLGRGWGVVFVPVVATLPLVLLAGVVRYRLLEVDVYVGRTFAYGAVLVLVLSVYAAAAALAGGSRSSGRVVAVLVAVAAALTGHRLRELLERRVDGWLTGGRIRGHALVRHLAHTLEREDSASIARHTAETVASGLDVSWVRVVVEGAAVAVAGRGQPSSAPEVTVDMVVGGEAVGALECGPRRGGWSADDVTLLDMLGRHAGLALRSADLAAALEVKLEEIAASRARLVAAEDAARRQIERDLHDGIQQQLVVLLARLELLRSMLDADSPAAKLATSSHEQARRSLVELRDLVRGIHPPLLGDRGLVAAVEATLDQLPLPVSLDVDPRVDGVRFGPTVEAAAYYVICEATTNVIKHSGAARAHVSVAPDVDALQVVVRDEGRGFSTPGSGTGLAGLRDRVEALSGELTVTSAPGAGTTVTARLPVSAVERV